MSEVIITTHAYDRAKDRLGLKPKAIEALAKKAFGNGLSHSDVKGTVNRYITKLYLQYKQGNNIRLYGEHVYIFHSNVLITIFKMDCKLSKKVLKLYKKIKDKKEK